MVVGPTRDRMNMEVYLPSYDMTAFVPRKCILPVKPDSLQWYPPAPPALSDYAMATAPMRAFQVPQHPEVRKD